MKLSVLMPAKNAAAYAIEAVRSLAPAELEWELVVVDDHSTDSTWDVLSDLATGDSRVNPLRNRGTGKVAALNLAYEHCVGDVITTLDSDDALDPSYFDSVSSMLWDADAACRDYTVTDSEMKPIGTYRMSEELIRDSFADVVSGLVSLPRATWTFKRSIAERVFPIPEDLPFEDVWFSLIIKRFAGRIRHFDRPLYYYRQHESQTFGGVLDYRPEKTRFRAQRLARYAELLPMYASRFDMAVLPDLGSVRKFYSLMMQETLHTKTILCASLGAGSKAKLFLFRKLWRVLGLAKRVQWALDANRTGAARS